MWVKALSVGGLLFSLAILVFAGMAFSELRSAATSPAAPSANSMPLTKIIGPELFAPGSAGTKPAVLASRILNRIYAIGGVAILLAAISTLFLALTRSQKPERNGQT